MRDTITAAMRDVLIEHIDGAKVPIIRAETLKGELAHRTATRAITVRALLAHRLLTTDRPAFPRATRITHQGRAVLAAALADWADALSRAGHVVLPPSPA